MNYTIKTLISVLVLAIVVLLTATQVSAQPECEVNQHPFIDYTLLDSIDLTGTSQSATLHNTSGLNCETIYVQFMLEVLNDEMQYEFVNLGKKKAISENRDSILTITFPQRDWTSFENENLWVKLTNPANSDDSREALLGSLVSYTSSKRSGTKSVTGYGGLRPGYITCLVAERDDCGTVNPQARGMIGMSTETPKETKETKTAPVATQKSTVVSVEKGTTKTTETTETNERPTVVAQDESADSTTSEETSGVPQLKYTIKKRNRFMIDVN